ncbi:MAG: hypothetical protein HRU34_13865 [Richelia sp.]|nr:hypothetical protein [Richelia sp.]
MLARSLYIDQDLLKIGVTESGDDFTKFSTIFQWFQTLIHPLIQQRRNLFFRTSLLF